MLILLFLCCFPLCCVSFVSCTPFSSVHDTMFLYSLFCTWLVSLYLIGVLVFLEVIVFFSCDCVF